MSTLKHTQSLGTDHLTWRGGGYGFLFRSEKKFPTTQELEYLFFLSGKARIFFPEFNIRFMTKTLNQIIFFFLHQNQNIFFSNNGNQNIFFFKLNGRSLRKKSLSHKMCCTPDIFNNIFRRQFFLERDISMIFCGHKHILITHFY